MLKCKHYHILHHIGVRDLQNQDLGPGIPGVFKDHSPQLEFFGS